MIQENLKPKNYPVELHIAMNTWIVEMFKSLNTKVTMLRFHTDADKAELKYLRKLNASK